MKRYFLLLIIVGLFLFNPVKEYLSNKPDINFVNDDKLMWLVDVNSEQYTMNTKEYYTKKYKVKLDGKPYTCNLKIVKSYECYLEKVNNNPAYKYSDWRLATADELLRLEIKRSSFMRWFVSEKTADNAISYDTDLFYDGKSVSFSSDFLTPDDYGYSPNKLKVYAVYFGRRYPTKLTWSKRKRSFVSRPAGASAVRGVATRTLPIRLVRDREPSKYWVSRAWSGLLLLLIGLLLYKTPNMWRAIKQWRRDTFLPTPDDELEEKYRRKD